MKQKTINFERKKLQLKKSTIEIFSMGPKCLRTIMGKGKTKPENPNESGTCDTVSQTK